jgi:hypothetical protein
MLTIVERGADILAASSRIDEDTAVTLKAEVHRRVEAETFFGHIAYASPRNRHPALTCQAATCCPTLDPDRDGSRTA